MKENEIISKVTSRGLFKLLKKEKKHIISQRKIFMRIYILMNKSL